MGTIMLLLGILASCTLVAAMSMPSRWKRVDGVVKESDGTRAVIAYTANGPREARLEFRKAVAVGDVVELVYHVDSPGSYEHARIRRSTLLVYAIPVTIFFIALGAALVAFG